MHCIFVSAFFILASLISFTFCVSIANKQEFKCSQPQNKDWVLTLQSPLIFHHKVAVTFTFSTSS